MSNELLYCVSVVDNSESTGAGAELLGAIYENISSWKDEETKKIRHTVYFLTEEEGKNAFSEIEKSIPEWASFDILLDDIQYSTLKKEDWAESWKLHFKTIVASERIVVKPTWEKFEPSANQIVIELDPGMSFGTGRHATTKSCLAAIDKFTSEDTSRTYSFLDAGAGSGILAIAAKKLGCSPVAAFDIDPDTIPVAYENAEKNNIAEDGITFEAASLEGFESDVKYDIVAANILSSALVAGREKLLSLTKNGGKLILAGILASEYPSVKAEFEKLGCRELSSITEGEWQGGTFVVP